jgi:hypothetical protein
MRDQPMLAKSCLLSLLRTLSHFESAGQHVLHASLETRPTTIVHDALAFTVLELI